ncbi:DUF2244 domain-containing protein [Falsiroseomonas oryzae]|uniref:DUF2244 domain-containing protein n=1 Tax=Falsiroseomonas oryzae TaxID=2766473 RepID=UPI0022EA52D2|nr:DUF2244 domain-containing protein [Roseomonas sp. MO-31]
MSGVGPIGREGVLFEAVSSPPGGLSARGMRWLCGLALAAAAVPALVFTLMGAWPVLGFLGVEVLLVLGLVATHRRWSRAASETVLLTEGRLLVRRADGRGGQEEAELEPYWARVELEERAGAVPVLTASARGRRVELGRFLSAEEKRELAAALLAALRRYRSPRFDNPQLRE